MILRNEYGLSFEYLNLKEANQKFEIFFGDQRFKQRLIKTLQMKVYI